MATNWVRTVCMGSSEGLKRGIEVVDTGKPISMPVGEGVMGRVFNVVGETVDEQGPIKADQLQSNSSPAAGFGGSVHQPTVADDRHQGH